jgi:predicted dehydrogenase
MAQSAVRWGVLGASNIANKFVSDLQRVAGAEVVAVASRDIDRSKAFAHAHEIPMAYGSYQELAEAPEIDVIYVSTVHSWHYAHVKMCLEAGKAVLCEKAFTVHLHDAEELVNIAKDRHLFLMEAMWTRCNPLINELGTLVRSGEIGEIRQIQANLGPSAGRNPRLWDPGLGGGILLECGVYPLNFAYFFLGDPSQVFGWSHLTSDGVDDATAILLRYESGAAATLTTSVVRDIGTGHVSNGRVLGTLGWVDVPTDVFCPQEYAVHKPGVESRSVHREREGNGYIEEAAEATRCVREGRTESELMPLADTLGVMKIIDAVYGQVGLSYPDNPKPSERGGPGSVSEV